MARNSLSIGARWIFPVEGEPVENGVLRIRDGRIDEIVERGPWRPDIALGNAAIVPGFVNAHTHLELESIVGDDPKMTVDEIDWLRRVIAQRRTRGPGEAEAAIDRNLGDSIRAGTTLLADITTAGASWKAISDAPIRAVVFSEVIGLRRDRAFETSRGAWEWLASIRPEDQIRACARPGLSPHAPYSTVGWLYERAAQSGLPLTTHLAEMPEEAILLKGGRGRLRSFLEDIGAWDPEWEAIGPRPADYVRKGGLRKADWLIAHGTYLEPEDFWQLRSEAAPEDQRVAVAYCPRTHARFGHAPHPFREMLARGVVVCLGTDSRASSPSLSVLDEARFLYRADPSLGGRLLLTMATLFGSWALRADAVTGSLKSGKSADLAFVALPDREDSDPYALLFDSDRPVVGTAFEGAIVHGPGA